MTKRKNFKQLNVAKYEALGSTGGWSSIGYFEKVQGAQSSAWVDSVKISYILEGDNAGNDQENRGYLWCASNDNVLSGTDEDNSDHIITGSASGSAGGGIARMSIKRRILENSNTTESSTGRVYLHVRCTDTGSDTPNLTMILESWGRWHTFVPL